MILSPILIELNSDIDLLNVVRGAPVTYMLRCVDWYKIGYTHNLKSRIEMMRTGNPFPIKVVYAIQTERYKELEEALHSFFGDRNRYREWFQLLAENEFRFEKFVKDFLWPKQEDHQ